MKAESMDICYFLNEISVPYLLLNAIKKIVR